MKRIHRFLSVVLVLALSISLFAVVPAHAVQQPTSGPCGDDLSWSWDESSRTLHISGTGPMWDYEEPEEVPWIFLNNLMSEVGESEIDRIVLDKGITYIGSYAFYGCGGVFELTIPEGVAAIGAHAFELCCGLSKVSFPESLRTIGEAAFIFCYNLSVFTLPSGLKDIESQAFWGCSEIRVAMIPAALEHLGVDAYERDYAHRVEIAPGNTRFYLGDSNDLYCRSGKDVTLVGTFSKLTSFTVPEGVTAIGPGAFAGQYGMESITLPDSVKTLGDEAFYNCSSLESITLPKGLISIGGNCFYWCYSLQALHLPDSVTDIGDFAFESCYGLHEVVLPKSLTRIPNSAFAYCEDLGSIAIPASVTSIGDEAFENSGLTEITLPAGITSIGSRAFAATSLSEVAIPASVTFLGEGAFADCYDLTRVTVDSRSAYLSSDSKKAVYYKNGEKCVLLWAPRNLTAYEVPEGVTAIGESAFCGCDRLKTLTLPESLRAIGANAFYNCWQLQSVRLPEGLTSIGDGAFWGCESLKEMTIPAGLTDAGYAVFGNSGLEKVVFSDGIRMIPENVCCDCYRLEEVVLPESVTEIGRGAFSECDALYEIDIPDSVRKIGAYAFCGCSELDDVHLPAALEVLGEGAFESCRGLKSIQLPETLERMEACVFEWTSLKEIVIPEGVTSIGEYAFADCEHLRSVTLPASVSEIDRTAFYECERLEKWNISTDSTHFCTDEAGYLYNTDAGKTLIWVPYGIENCVIPEGVTAIGEYAFYECEKLETVTLPEGLTGIGKRAFFRSSLCSIDLPGSLTSIGDEAFAVTQLASVTIPEGVKSIGHSAFEECWKLTNVNLPASLQTLEGYAFLFDPSLRDIFFAGTEAQWNELGGEGKDTLGSNVHVVFGTTHDCAADSFLDVPSYTNWAHAGIDYCIDAGLMNGVDEYTFNPDGTVTRGQLVTILYRVAGSPEVTFAGTFADVKDGRFYSDAVEWAAGKGIVNGVGDDRFNPNGAVTREQIAAILYRYNGSPKVSGDLKAFPDAGKAHTYAKDALVWATSQGLINGIKSGSVTNLAPQASATRAQIATIIMRMMQ